MYMREIVEKYDRSIESITRHLSTKLEASSIQLSTALLHRYSCCIHSIRGMPTPQMHATCSMQGKLQENQTTKIAVFTHDACR